MHHATALRVAIELFHMPSRVRILRSSPLPEGIVLVLRIVAGDVPAVADGAELTDRSPVVVRKAAAFFVEQVLLHLDADSYRVLGASRDATANELRRNMALLLTWLHPDVDRGGDQSIFAARVTRAWEDLKTPERRAAYDKSLGVIQKKKQSRNAGGRATSRSLHVRQRRYYLGQTVAFVREERLSLLRRFLSVLLGTPR